MSETKETNHGGGGGGDLPPTYFVKPDAAPASTLDEAIRAARVELAKAWRETGSWRDYCDAGPAATAVVTVALKFIGHLDLNTARGVAKYLRSARRADGGFPSYPGGDKSDLAATGACYAGLIAAGVPENDPDARAAKTFIDAHGGEAQLIELARAGDLAALALAMMGKLSRDLPTAPLLFGLTPGSEYLLAHRFGYLVPFRALVSDVIGAYLRRAPGRPTSQASLRPLRRTTSPTTASQVASQFTTRLNAVSDYATGAVTKLTRSGADLTASMLTGTTRTMQGIAQAGLSTAADIADAVRLGPGHLLATTLQGALDTGRTVVKGAVAAVSTAERLRPGAKDAGRSALQTIEGLRCERYLNTFRNGDGSWLYGDSIHTALALAAYRALGYSSSDQEILDSVDWLKGDQIKVTDEDGNTSFNVFYTDIWPTAFSLRALLESGTPITDPAISRAINWLIAVQRSGTWAFQSTNNTTPDMDDTAMAMATLAIARNYLAQAADSIDGNLGASQQPSLLDRCNTAIEAAKVVVFARQNPDGGWASYQSGLPGKKAGAIMTAEPVAPALDSFNAQVAFIRNPPVELGDPATEDVTARVLFALGKSGVTASDPTVEKAIQFLINQQDTNHGWWGRWVVNYLASTAWVLRGLVAVRADLKAPFVQNAIGFLLGRQGNDGGWRDSIGSYRKPTEKVDKATKSNPCLTGLVLCALIELGEGASARTKNAITKGLFFLRKYHHEHETWKVDTLDTLHTLYPPALFYTLPQTALQLPLEALGLSSQSLSRNAGAIHSVIPTRDEFATLRSPITPEQINALKSRGDTDADALIDEIWTQPSTVASEGARIAAFFQSLVKIADFSDQSHLDGLAPTSSPATVRGGRALNPVADLDLNPGRLANARALFQRSGFGVPLVLFASSLPQCYAVPYGARILLASGRLTTNPLRRMIETAQFIFDVLSPDGLVEVSDVEVNKALAAKQTPPGRGLRTARKVRLLHAAVRKLVAGTPLQAGDPPIRVNQFEMIGTLMSFSVLVTDGLRALGLTVSETEADDWFFLWRQVGKALGVAEPVGFKLDTAADGAEFFEHTRSDWGASAEGAQLARVSLDVLKQSLPGDEFDGIGPTLVRHLAGERCADLLSVEPSDWTQFLINSSPLVETVESRLIGSLTDTPLTPLLKQAAYGTMVALSQQQRVGLNQAFSIPPDLLDAWQNEFQADFRA